MGAVTFLMLLVGFGGVPAHADVGGAHPGYLHALSDLRLARWLVTGQSSNALIGVHDRAAYQQIEQAIQDLKAVAVDDGRDINYHPAVDVPTDRHGRLETALKALYRAHHDMDSEEQNHPILNLRHTAAAHIDQAINSVVAAINDVQNHRS
jgi:hypothetical protein